MDSKVSFTCFVSMPFDESFDNIFLNGLILSNEYMSNYSIDFVRLDKQAYEQRRIEQNVLTSIDRSDFVIADISKYPDSPHANVSVMHEVGYACGKDIPFLLIGKKDTFKKVPSNLQGSLLVEYNNENDVELKQFAQKLAIQLEELITTSVRTRVRGQFRAEGFNDREKIGISELISSAKRRVYILTTNLDYTNTYLKPSLEAALKNNEQNPTFKIEILTIDPESEVTNARAAQLGTPVRKYRDLMRESLEAMGEAFGENKKVDIHAYKEFPTQKTFMIDDTIITSISALGLQSREGTHYVMNNSHEATESFMSHFKTLKMLAVAGK
ncbi:MAG: hypothetical protein GXP08_03675 [Gammaproteobacteria bacterium]|nr:hypothetical protein [Gammaproteobacteria bacterium]